LDSFRFFATKRIEHIYNRLFTPDDNFTLFDITYSEGELITKEEVRTTMLHMAIDTQIPEFTLDREGFLVRVYASSGFEEIRIDNHTDFARRFYLLGDDEPAVKDFFSDELVLFFEGNPYYHVESHANGLLVFHNQRTAGVNEVRALIDFGKRLRQAIEQNTLMGVFD